MKKFGMFFFGEKKLGNFVILIKKKINSPKCSSTVKFIHYSKSFYFRESSKSKWKRKPS